MCLTCGTSKLTRTIRKVAPEESRNIEDKDDRNNRDKKNINGHIHDTITDRYGCINVDNQIPIHFEDVLGEPNFDIGAHDCVWINSYTCYNFWKNGLYCCVSTLCALPLSILYGLAAFWTAFCHIWVLTPCHTCLQLSCCHCLGAINGLFWACMIEPVARACGEIFWACKKGGAKPKFRNTRNKVTFNKTVKFKTIPPRKS